MVLSVVRSQPPLCSFIECYCSWTPRGRYFLVRNQDQSREVGDQQERRAEEEDGKETMTDGHWSRGEEEGIRAGVGGHWHCFKALAKSEWRYST